MGARMDRTILNWRWWAVLPLIAVLGIFALAGNICAILSAIFGAAAEGVEELNIRPLIDWTRRKTP